MQFIFITRCYRPTNLAEVKKNIRMTFEGTGHTYRHLIIVDLTHGGKRSEFTAFADDDKTDLYFVSKKQPNDSQMSIPVDAIIREYDTDDDWVYYVDDDNLLHPDFLDVCEYCTNDWDAVVFQIEGRYHTEAEIRSGNMAGNLDWDNFVVRLGVMKNVGVFTPGTYTYLEDGKFFNRMRALGYRIRFVDKEMGWYNKLNKPYAVTNHFLFLTRCYKTDNLEKVKSSIFAAFKKYPDYYRHIILADLTHGTPREEFDKFKDHKTTVFYVDHKNENDSQCTEGMDSVLGGIMPLDDNEYVYILDDDNLLHPDFLWVSSYCKGKDAIVFKIKGRPELGKPDILNTYPVGHIDWANFVTKLTTMQRIKVYHLDGPRRCEDGVFFDHMKRENCTFEFVNHVMAWYNKLRSIS